jgi:hypothetical protein
MNIRHGAALAVTLLFFSPVTKLAAQQPAGVVLKSGAIEIQLNGRVHTQFNTTTVEDEPATEMELRRIRLEATVKVNDLVSGRIQPDFAPGNRVVMKDAYLRLSLDPGLNFLAGQAHRPFSPLTITSSNRIIPIERGVRIRGLDEAWDEHNLVRNLGYTDRDVGLQVMGSPRGAPMRFSYAAGFFNGPARGDAEGENTYQLAARVSVEPLRLFRVGAAWSRRDFVREPNLPESPLDVEGGQAFLVDAELGAYDSAGVHLAAEAAYGDFDPHTGSRFFGAQGWLAYRTRPLGRKISAVEPLIRISHGDPDVNDRGDEGENGGGLLLTPGINLYLGGQNRVMFNYDFWSPTDGERQGSFKTQFQLAF